MSLSLGGDMEVIGGVESAGKQRKVEKEACTKRKKVKKQREKY